MVLVFVTRNRGQTRQTRDLNKVSITEITSRKNISTNKRGAVQQCEQCQAPNSDLVDGGSKRTSAYATQPAFFSSDQDTFRKQSSDSPENNPQICQGWRATPRAFWRSTEPQEIAQETKSLERYVQLKFNSKRFSNSSKFLWFGASQKSPRGGAPPLGKFGVCFWGNIVNRLLRYIIRPEA